MTHAPLFNLGFRPFFFCAGLYAVISVLVWSLVYLAGFKLPLETVSPFQWHAHEMIYGYAAAVITGFLLTAVKNWTGVQTLHGMPLLLLVCLWMAARLFFNLGLLPAAAVFDLLFLLCVAASLIGPIRQAGQWKHMAIISKLLLFFIGNLLFYLGTLGYLENGIFWGIYGGLYLVISLILMIGRRVVPFFIERGVGYPVSLRQSRLLDVGSLVVFLVFFILELGQFSRAASAWTALLLFFINAARLIGWHTPGIWRKPLLWSLYLALWSVCFGFLLVFLAYLPGLSVFIAVHAFAYGGIGLMTLAMMSRVSLGHTGRDIHNPPAGIGLAFGLLLIGTLIRVALPVISPPFYLWWIGASQVLWILAFLIFCYLFIPVLSRARIDGEPG